MCYNQLVTICANEECRKEFVQKNKYRETKTCSKECRYAVSAKTTRESSGRWMTSVCPCGVEFQNAMNKPKKYHDRDCMMKHRVEDSRATRTCENPECGKEFTHFKRQNQRTCSPECRNKVTARQRDINYPECRTCGVSTGSYNRVYCDEHRPNRPGRKPLPRKTAVCRTCGEDFSRPGTWPGQMMFCSLKCSNAQHSRKRARHYQFGDLNLNSSYELRFVACLERLQIYWQPWPDDRFFDHNGHEYRPDFIVNGHAIEVKGWDHPDSSQPAARAAWNLPEPLVIVTRDRLNELERIFNQSQFLESLAML